MSQRQSSNRQLTLVFGNSPGKTKPLKINSISSRNSRGRSSASPFQRKVGRLERERPAAAAFLEKLVDEVLDERPLLQWPALE